MNVFRITYVYLHRAKFTPRLTSFFLFIIINLVRRLARSPTYISGNWYNNDSYLSCNRGGCCLNCFFFKLSFVAYSALCSWVMSRHEIVLVELDGVRSFVAVKFYIISEFRRWYNFNYVRIVFVLITFS